MDNETADLTTPLGTSTMNGSSSTTNADGTVRRVAQKAHEAVDTVEQALATGSEKVMDWHQEYGELAREQIRANPLAVVAGAFAVGYLFAKITR